MELDAAIKGRRSIRRFLPDPVPAEDIRNIIDAARYAPSASNRQHWRFIIIDDSMLIQRIHTEGGAQSTVTKAPALIAVLFHNWLSKEHFGNVQSVAAAVQNMMLKCYELGYGSCWIAGFGNEKKVKELLHVPFNYDIMCLLALGKPTERPPDIPRRPYEELVFHNFYTGEEKDMPMSIRSSKWEVKQIKAFHKYGSRAKGMGKDYELYSDEEITAAKNVIKKELDRRGKSKVLTFVTYDGTFLRKIEQVFEGHEHYDCELDDDIAKFVWFKVRNAKYIIIGEDFKIPEKYDVIIVPFSLEKYPWNDQIVKNIVSALNPGGSALFFFKNRYSIYNLYYNAIEKILGVKNIEQFIYPGPYEPISIFRLNKVLTSMRCNITTSNLFLISPEFKEYTRKIDNYLIRHGDKLTIFKHAVKVLLKLFLWGIKKANKIKIPYFCSIQCVKAEKKSTFSDKLSSPPSGSLSR